MNACAYSCAPVPSKLIQCEQQDKGGQVAHVGPGQSAGSTLVGQTGEPLLMEVVEAGDVASVRQLIDCVDPMAQQGLALFKAFQHGHEEIFDLLYTHLSKREIYWSALLCTTAALGTFAAVERSRGHLFKHVAFADLAALGDDPVGYVLRHANPSAWQHLALRRAARCGHLEILERLLGLSFPHALRSDLLRGAIAGGSLDVFKRLLALSGEHFCEREAVLRAARLGKRDILAWLLSRSDPNFNGSAALAYAAAEGHDAIVDLLWEVSHPESALMRLAVMGRAEHAGTQALRKRLIAERERAALQDATPAINACALKPTTAGRRL